MLETELWSHWGDLQLPEPQGVASCQDPFIQAHKGKGGAGDRVGETSTLWTI